MKLISMTDYVLNAFEKHTEETDMCLHNTKQLSSIINYANFLKQPLELWMFVPCDKNGNVLEEPNLLDVMNDKGYYNYNKYDTLKEKYQQAKERVIFEGFYIHQSSVYYPNQNLLIDVESFFYDFQDIEWLLNNSFQDLTLTENAIKNYNL